MTMKRFVVITLTALALTGCASSTPDADPEPETDCIEVSEGTAEALRDGITDDDVTLDRIVAVSAPNSKAWFVAAEYESSAGDEGRAVWYTIHDPAGDDNAFTSVDAVAEVISMFARPADASAAMDGAQLAEACLNN